MKSEAEKSKPVIGILAAVDDERNTSIQYPYVHAIEQSGGVPVVLPYVQSDETTNHFVSLCDGFLFSGGSDIDPANYGEKASYCGTFQHYRDLLERKVFEKAFRARKPIMGICRGAQLINVALGGTLYQDIASEPICANSHVQSEPKNALSHDVQIRKETPLFDLVGAERMIANSFHHQAVKRIGRGLKIMAAADDGVIEALYLPDFPYLRAYQWHPERLYEISLENRKLFLDWIEACRICGVNA